MKSISQTKQSLFFPGACREPKILLLSLLAVNVFSPAPLVSSQNCVFKADLLAGVFGAFSVHINDAVDNGSYITSWGLLPFQFHRHNQTLSHLQGQSRCYFHYFCDKLLNCFQTTKETQ